MLHHFLGTDSFDITEVHFHAHDCCGQNKKKQQIFHVSFNVEGTYWSQQGDSNFISTSWAYQILARMGVWTIYSSDNTGKCKSGAKMILSKAVNEFAAPKLVGAQEA